MKQSNISEDTLKWEKSQPKINQLLEANDISTITMLEFYKLYINSPYNQVAISLFELAFNSWYDKNMKG